MAYGASDHDQEILLSWSVKLLRAQFDAYPPDVQQAIRADVMRRLHNRRHPQSALRRLAGPVYGVKESR